MLSVFSRPNAVSIINTDKADFVQLAEILAKFLYCKNILSFFLSVLCSVEIPFT